MVDTVSAEEYLEELQLAFTAISEKLDGNDQVMLKGVLKFYDRVKKYPVSRLTSALHSFMVQTSASLKTATPASLKKVKRGIIYVQREAIKRRKFQNGSKNAVMKGLNKRSNPFVVVPARKRKHNFAENVAQNESVPKQAGRSMETKTRVIVKSSKSSVKME